MSTFARLVLACSIISAASALSHSGYGTAYSDAFEIDKTGFNACQIDASKLGKRWNTYYAALNEADWKEGGAEAGVCGKCIKTCGEAGCVISMIVDLCPAWACKRGNVDFSMPALEAATGFDWDHKPITWDFIECDASDASIDSVDNTDKDKIASQATGILNDIQDLIQDLVNVASGVGETQLAV